MSEETIINNDFAAIFAYSFIRVKLVTYTFLDVRKIIEEFTDDNTNY